MKVVILYYAGKNQDDEDTLEGVKGIAESCRRLKYQVIKVKVNQYNWQKATKTSGDVVFNFVEDEKWDLYVKVGRGLEKLKRAQVGHDLGVLKFSTQKRLVKQTLIRHGLSTPEFKIFGDQSEIIDSGLKYPLIVKPAHEHAGIGISQASVVSNLSELKNQAAFILKKFKCDAIAEEFVAGREIHATVMGNGNRIMVLPLCEIRFIGKFKKNWSIYTYESKWDKKSWEYWDARVDSPAKIPQNLTNEIKKLVKKAYGVFLCRDIARFDIRISKNNQPLLIDVNINPSLNIYDEQDATVASVKANGWSYDQFIDKLLQITRRRVYG